jgi:hypothetical protein
MRLPGAALLIVIGMAVLWLAANGKLSRMATAWNWVTEKDGATLDTPATAKPVSYLDQVLRRDTLHVNTMVSALSRSSANNVPGGVLA